MLKQYLFQLGELGFLFESKQNRPHENHRLLKTENTQSTQDRKEQGSNRLNEAKHFTINFIRPFRSLARLLAYFLVCLFTLIILMYNKSEQSSIEETATSQSIWILNGKCYLIENALKYKSQFCDPINEALQTKVQHFLLKNTNLLKLAAHDNDAIKETSFSYFNAKLPYNLIFIYFFCSLLIISSPRENKSHSLKFDFAVWFASLLMLVVNFKKCMKVFQLHGMFDSFTSNSFQPILPTSMSISSVSLDYTFVFAQVVFVSVIFKVGAQVYKYFVKNSQLVSKKEELNSQQQAKLSTAGANFNFQNLSIATPYTNFSFPGSAIRQSKSFVSNNNQQLSNFFMDNSSQRNVIQPAKFMLKQQDAKSVFQFRTLSNGSASFLNGSFFTN